MRAYSTFRVRTYQPMQCELASPSSAARCWVEVIATACKLYIRSIAALLQLGPSCPCVHCRKHAATTTCRGAAITTLHHDAHHRWVCGGSRSMIVPLRSNTSEIWTCIAEIPTAAISPPAFYRQCQVLSPDHTAWQSPHSCSVSVCMRVTCAIVMCPRIVCLPCPGAHYG